MATLTKTEFTLSKTAIRRARRHDKIVRWIVTMGGVAVIVSVISILVLIVGVTLPLFRFSQVKLLAEQPLPASLSPEKVVAVGIDKGLNEKSLLVAHVLSRDGTVTFLDLHTGKVLERARANPPDSPRSKTIHPSSTTVLGVFVDLVRRHDFGRGNLGADGRQSRQAGPGHLRRPHPRQRAAGKGSEARSRGPAGVERPGRLRELRRLAGGQPHSAGPPGSRGEPVGRRDDEDRADHAQARIAAALGPWRWTRRGRRSMRAPSDGALLWWRLGDDGQVIDHEAIPAFADKRAMTAMSLLLGDVSLAVGDADGGLTTWFFVRGGDGKSRKLRQIHTLRSHAAAVEQIVPSRRNKGMLSFDHDGAAAMDYMTSERHLASLGGGASRDAPAWPRWGCRRAATPWWASTRRAA